jgi:hypothetical protein
MGGLFISFRIISAMAPDREASPVREITDVESFNGERILLARAPRWNIGPSAPEAVLLRRSDETLTDAGSARYATVLRSPPQRPLSSGSKKTENGVYAVPHLINCSQRPRRCRGIGIRNIIASMSAWGLCQNVERVLVTRGHDRANL